MWSFNGFFYRGEQWTPSAAEPEESNSLLQLLALLGATEEQQARILARPAWETPYEDVWREMTTERFGRVPLSTEYSTEDWPQMLGTWDVTAHQHPFGQPPLKYSADRKEKHQDFCPCELAREAWWDPGLPAEECPLYEGRDLPQTVNN